MHSIEHALGCYFFYYLINLDEFTRKSLNFHSVIIIKKKKGFSYIGLSIQHSDKGGRPTPQSCKNGDFLFFIFLSQRPRLG